MTPNLRFGTAPVCAFGVVLSVLASPVAFAQDRRPTGPSAPPQPSPPPPGNPQPTDPSCPPAPCPTPASCPPEQRDRIYEIRITSIDVARVAVPAVTAILASTSNREDQRDGLQAQAKRGIPIARIAYGPTVNVPQNATRTRENDRDAGPEQPHSLFLPELRTRITAHPHLTPDCAEAVDLFVEQASLGSPWTGTGTRSSLTFENGDTKLVREVTRPDGTRHLVFATVFFPLRSLPCP